METFNIDYAATHLAQLVEQAVLGEPFLIETPGKVMVKVMVADAPDKPIKRRIGFLEGKYKVPEDMTALDAEVAEMFNRSCE